MKNLCPACGGKGAVATDCPYCRDSDAFEHDDLAGKSCSGCGGSGYLEDPCPSCGGSISHFRRVS